MQEAVDKYISQENQQLLQEQQKEDILPLLTIQDDTKKQPTFGELFITNDELNGSIDSLRHFKGKLVTNVCGGQKKLFVIEEEFEDGIISTLHAPEYDDLEYTYSEEGRTAKNLEEIFSTFENRGQIKKITCGKKHTMILTQEGKLFSYGVGEYGSLGHGGIVLCTIPRPITKISQKKILQVACGEFHTLALTSQHDLYAWGRGFEGQLGLKNQQTASVPTCVKFFYQGFDLAKLEDKKIKLTHIVCGSYHSLALDENGQLYVWGEAKLGQCGTGKKSSEPYPTIIRLEPQNNDVQVQSQVKINPFQQRPVFGYRVVKVAAGFGHTACLTESGQLFTWGFNIMGQLGLGDLKSKYYPQRVTKDILGNQIPVFVNLNCGYNNTFAIDDNGTLWSWGGGNLGQKNDKKQDLPRKILENTENRKFTEICSISNAATFFAPIRTMSVRPNYGPSSGGTLISLLGTGFTDTGKQSLKFLFAERIVEVSLNYDNTTDSFNCMTPNFNEIVIDDDKVKWPLLCKLEVTLDGKIYSHCEQQYLIYDNKLNVSSINPKCGSVQGGTQLEMFINIDNLTASYLKHLTIGFQKRNKNQEKLPSKKEKNNYDDVQTPAERMQKSQQQQQENKTVNPLDLSQNDAELDKENFICVDGEYSQGKITCIVPKLDEYSVESMQYNVDISLNGQQFTGQPSSFRFYDVQVGEIIPNNDVAKGGTQIKITGEGFFDTLNKKIMLETQFGQRLRDVTFDKQKKCFYFVAPPAAWLLGGQDENPELLNSIYEKGVDVKLTLNGCHWIYVSKLYYLEINIERIGPVVFDPTWNENDKKNHWVHEEAEKDPFQGIVDEHEIDKKKNEIKLKLDEENQEMETLFKKSSQYLYLYGQNFIPGENYIQFQFQNQLKVVRGVFKNSSKLGVQIPDFDDFQIPVGINEIQIEISFNGQSYSQCKKAFRYMAFDKNATPQERQKLEDEELKKIKAPQKKAAKK